MWRSFPDLTSILFSLFPKVLGFHPEGYVTRLWVFFSVTGLLRLTLSPNDFFPTGGLSLTSIFGHERHYPRSKWSNFSGPDEGIMDAQALQGQLESHVSDSLREGHFFLKKIPYGAKGTPLPEGPFPRVFFLQWVGYPLG